MAVNKNGIVVIGAVFVDIKGFPEDIYIPDVSDFLNLKVPGTLTKFLRRNA